MAATIIRRVPVTGVDQRMRLVNAQFARSFDIGSWSKIRIGLRLSLTSSTVNPSGSIQCFVGLCHGTTNLPGDSVCDYAVGWYFNTAVTVTNGGTDSCAYNIPTVALYSKVNTTWSSLNSLGSAGMGGAADLSGLQRNLILLDYIKGTPWTMNAQYRSSASGLVDVDSDTLMGRLESETLSTLAGHTLVQGKTVAVDEAFYGTLDTVAVWWGRSAPAMEVSDIAIVRFA